MIHTPLSKPSSLEDRDEEGTDEPEAPLQANVREEGVPLHTASRPSQELSCSICFDLLMDPCSLSCGHTFCELCLAKVWKNEAQNWREQPSSILCPSCRIPSEAFPQINYALRNLLDSDPASRQSLESRRSQLTDEEKSIIEAVKASRNDYRQKAQTSRTEGLRHRGRGANIHFNVNIGGNHRLGISPFPCLVAIIVGFSIGALFYLAIVDGDEYDHVEQWSEHEVAEWIATKFDKWGPELVQHIRDEGMDGRRLLRLTQRDLEYLGVETAFRRKSFLIAVEELREGKCPTVPASLDQFNDYYFKDTLMVLIMYRVLEMPNMAVWMTYFTNYEHAFLPFYKAALNPSCPLVTWLASWVSGSTSPPPEVDNQGGDNQGGDNQGGDNQGSDNQGSDNQGSDNQGGDNQGSDNQGSDNQGGDNQGGDNQGGDNQGSDNQGSDNQGFTGKHVWEQGDVEVLSFKQLFFFWLLLLCLSPHVFSLYIALNWIFVHPIISLFATVYLANSLYSHLWWLRDVAKRGVQKELLHMWRNSVVACVIKLIGFWIMFPVLWRVLPTFVWSIVYYSIVFGVYKAIRTARR